MVRIGAQPLQNNLTAGQDEDAEAFCAVQIRALMKNGQVRCGFAEANKLKALMMGDLHSGSVAGSMLALICCDNHRRNPEICILVWLTTTRPGW